MKTSSFFHFSKQKKNAHYQDLLNILNKTTECETNTKFRKAICRSLNSKSWSLNAKVIAGSQITISAANNNCGIAVQTGNVARIYADLIKLCLMMKNKRIKTAFVLVPFKSLAKKWGSNTANFERVVQELKLFKKVINTPLVIIGVKP